MQGQRSSMGPLPETSGFDHGSTPSDASTNQQTCWNNMNNSAHSSLPDYLTFPDDPSGAYRHFPIQEGHSLHGWTISGPSSSGTQNHNNCSILAQSSSNAIPQDLNISAENLQRGSDDCHILENPQVQPSTSADPFWMPPGSGGYLMEENDGRSGNLLVTRRMSCKRKVLERNTGQSSKGPSSSYHPQADGHVWHAIPGGYNPSSGLSISNPLENVSVIVPSVQFNASSSVNMNAGLGISSGEAASESSFDLNLVGNAHGSLRNFRARISPHRQDSIPINVRSTWNSLQPMSSTPSATNNLRTTRSPPIIENLRSQRQSGVRHVSASRRTSSRWTDGSSTRRGHSSSSRDSNRVPHEEPNTITSPMIISEQHPMIIPTNDVRNSAQSSANWNLAGGNISAGSSSGVQLSGPNWVSHRNHPQYPRRLTELVRRSLLASIGSDNGSQSGNSLLSSGPSSQGVALSSGAGSQGHHLLNSRAGILLDRQLDGAVGFPYSVRTLAAASEGRSRLVTEIRNVLDLMRRGGNLRFEDFVILDHSLIFGVADIHDRHRDMRLDIDNMSYEELLALEEGIGNVNTGLSEETILNHLKQRKYFSITMGIEMEVEAEPCCVCQEEYTDGEDVGTLECGHEFHSNCIKQWLMHKNMCPICKTTGLSK